LEHFVSGVCSLSALILFVWHQERHPACKNPVSAISGGFLGRLLGTQVNLLFPESETVVEQKPGGCLMFV